jgi:hypothetical protein
MALHSDPNDQEPESQTMTNEQAPNIQRQRQNPGHWDLGFIWDLGSLVIGI